MSNSKLSVKDSDDEVLSPSAGKRLKLDDSKLSLNTEEFTTFLRHEQESVLKKCKGCLAELFFLENGKFLDFVRSQSIDDPLLTEQFTKLQSELGGTSRIEKSICYSDELKTALSPKSARESSPRIVSNRPKLLSPSGSTSSRHASPGRVTTSPMSPQRRTRHGTSEVSVPSAEQISVASLSSTQPTIIKESQESIAERARHEADVLRRVSELQKEGLWSAKRLPRCAEPLKPKCHWDNLLEEMQWMSSDFAEEKRWKKAIAKKIANAVVKHVNETGLNITLGCDEAVSDEEDEEYVAMRHCKQVALMIEEFWSQMLKLATWRIESRQAEKMKKERNKHLDFIVDQTEKFSSWLSEGLLQNTGTNEGQASQMQKMDVSVDTGSEEEDDDEFLPDKADVDDEDTIAIDEAADQVNHEEELDVLKQEADMGVDDLLASLPPEYLAQLGLKPGSSSQLPKEPSDTKEGQMLSSGNHANVISVAENNAESAHQDNSPEVSSAINEDEGEKNESEFMSRQQRLDKLSAVALSMQPQLGSDSTKHIPVPFLMRGGDLREYQRVGLDWLVMLHDKHINGILADEMGLGKTIQTIALLAHLACVKEIWGPHLIIVPASVLLNWEMEFKRWLPAFKVLTYYGSVKDRKEKRKGWTDQNAFHVCITSYQLAVIDQSVLKRRHWQYMILDEAQNIKNFRSRRWQALLSMQSQHRLLLTGTPLQNSLMELWSLMHFLMPHLFQSSEDFRDWFASPLASMVEGDREFSDNLIVRLHKVLRPFLLRRLKKDVEKQMPSKEEHLVPCRLSRRQRFLYDDFMSRASTKEVLQTGQFVSVLGILVQLRKVCNHPDLFEPRPVTSPFVMHDSLMIKVPFKLVETSQTVNPKALEWLVSENENFCGIDFDRRQELCPSREAFVSKYTSDVTETDLEKAKGNESLTSMLQRQIRLQCFRGLAGDQAVPCNIAVHSADLVESGGKKVGRLTESSTLKPPQIVFPLKNQESNFQEICERLNVKDSTAIATPPRAVVEKIYGEQKENADFLATLNENRCRSLAVRPIFGGDLLGTCSILNKPKRISWKDDFKFKHIDYFSKNGDLEPILQSFAFALHPVLAKTPVFYSNSKCANAFDRKINLAKLNTKPSDIDDLANLVRVRCMLNFPELRLIQYDCGKLQALDNLLRHLRNDGHRVLIFTQMSRMLDVLEQFLSYHGFAYLRLDGSTRLETRQVLVERFNHDKRIFCFILSTRAGGLGINLTGADTVVFYDSDWNPTTDAQAQDRCHRIGQTRDVHIYRLVSERTVEENVIRRAAQKRMLNELAIEGGDFTTARLKENALREIFGADIFGDDRTDSLPTIEEVENAVEEEEKEVQEQTPQATAFEEALLQAEGCDAGDEDDVAAARQARREHNAEIDENNFFLEQDLPTQGSAMTPTSASQQLPEPETLDEVTALEQQLRPVERMCLDVMERLIGSHEDESEDEDQIEEEFEFERLKSMQMDLVKKGDVNDSDSDESGSQSGESDADSSAMEMTYDRNAGQVGLLRHKNKKRLEGLDSSILGRKIGTKRQPVGMIEKMMGHQQMKRKRGRPPKAENLLRKALEGESKKKRGRPRKDRRNMPEAYVTNKKLDEQINKKHKHRVTFDESCSDSIGSSSFRQDEEISEDESFNSTSMPLSVVTSPEHQIRGQLGGKPAQNRTAASNGGEENGGGTSVFLMS